MFKFLGEVKGELKHVSWPTKHQAWSYTILVILISLFVAVYLGAFDWLFTRIVNFIISF
jgi:preprotein translocase subunit SecE